MKMRTPSARLEISSRRGIWVLLEQVEGAPQMAHVARKITHRQRVALAENTTSSCDSDMACEPTFTAACISVAISPRSLITSSFRRSRTCNSHGQAGVVGVQEVGRLHQLRRVPVGLGERSPRFCIAIGRDGDHQQAALGQAQKLDMPKHRGAARRHDPTDELRQVGQQAAALAITFAAVRACSCSGPAAAPAHGEHGVDEQAVARAPWNAPAEVWGWRSGQLLQVSHHVAYGGGDNFRPMPATGSGTHRLPIGDASVPPAP